MTEPTYSVTTERLYSRLPEFYRTFDAQNDYHFKKYISSIADVLGNIDELVARIEYVPPSDWYDYQQSLDEYNTYSRPAGLENSELGFVPVGATSDLLDGRTANASWLPYIGQLIGAEVGKLSEAEQRAAVVNNYLGFRAGSREALEYATKTLLTGTQFVRIYPHRDGAFGSITSEGTEWDILIVTKEDETPVGIDIAEIIDSRGAKPAGVVLHHISYAITWTILVATFPTWEELEVAGSWGNIELANADQLSL